MDGIDSNLSDLLEESIEIELSVSDLYSFFSDFFNEDQEFWWKLSLEEKNHAALLKSGRLYLKQNILPAEILYEGLQELRDINKHIKETLDEWLLKRPAMEEAYQLALTTEETAAELHFQRILEVETGQKTMQNRIIKIFQNLNLGDKDHAVRIRVLMVARGLSPKNWNN